MHKTTFFKISLFTIIFLQSFLSYSQNYVPFTPRYNKDIKGDMLLIGNSILNRNDGNKKRPNDAYNGNDLNSDYEMEYINIDNGKTKDVFNSSSANLVIPNPNSPSDPCYKIVYAGLYWGAVTKGSTEIKNVKFKMPTGGYNDIVGTVIHDSGNNVVGTSFPYACYADVTNLVTGVGNPNPQGTYTLANVSTKQGTNRPANANSGGTGLSAGWSLFIVYEDPKLPAKSITSFDGFSAISSTVNLDIPVSGFRTIPTGPVKVKFAFSALEGDQSIKGDYLMINNSVITAVNGAKNAIRSSDNFFNSSVTYIDPITKITENFLDRNPNSSNTLGYDAGILEINNNGNAIIKNNDTKATIGLRSNQDVYFYYFNAIALDIIEPRIILTKEVFDNASPPKNIGNTNVTLGQELYYNIGFQNVGNDSAENFTIKDILPINITFDPASIIVPNGSGIIPNYDPITRTIMFTVPKNLVEKGDPRYVIKFKVRVVPNCNDLSDACSDKIQNQAYATYSGIESKIKVDDQKSLATFGACYLGTPAPTNFLVGVDNCKYTKTYELCGADVILTAANGYNSYSWSKSPTGMPVIGTSQSITVTQIGTYYVRNTAVAPCLSIDQVVTVTPVGSVTDNPVTPFADQVVKCSNNNKDLPKIFLCGLNASKLIQTGITDALSIEWQKLREGSCPPIGIDDCANENASCVWDKVATGPNYTANNSGQFRLVINYRNGCFNRYYFNVYKNELNPKAVSRDIICDTKGEIVVSGVPAGYEYSLIPTGPFQDSNIFSISTVGTYTVYIKQKGAITNPCLFEVPSIDILARQFSVSEFVTQPACNGQKGSIKLAANDVRPGYYYKLSQGATIINSVGPIAQADFIFENLNTGFYTYEVRTDDKCLKTGNIEIKEPAVLSATIIQTKALTCIEGEIQVNVVGGTAPYSFYVNGSTSGQYIPEIIVSTAGKYDVQIIDYNGCTATATFTVKAIPPPVYTVVPSSIKCYGDKGSITFNVTNANGYTLSYSIDNGLNFQSGPVFSNLAAGTYTPVLQYTLSGSVCTITEPVITFTGPASAVTASGGVGELAGCGAGGEGLLRITNAQGGNPFPAPNYYEYSFDGGATWQTSKEKYVMPGNYILVIRDASGCTFTIPGIILDPKPTDPTIAVNPPTFSCNGSATTTVKVTNPANANYSYEYYLDGVLNTNVPANVFTNVPTGNRTVSVKYKLVSVPTYSNLLNEDFGIGANTTTSGIASAYCFHNLDIVPSTCPNSALTLEDNQYVVTRGLVPNNPAWFPFKDHTSNGTVANGRFLAVNIGSAAGPYGVLYSKPIVDVIPNQDVKVDLYLANLILSSFTAAIPDFIIELVTPGGVVVASQATGDIPNNQIWNLKSLSLNPGNNTSLTFKIRSGSVRYDGNDALIDDIKVYQLPKSCITQKDFPITVDSNKAFTASVTGFKDLTCAGANNGEITIVAQNFAPAGFYYSLDGAAFVLQATSPLVISNLSAGSHSVRVQYDLTASPCLFTLPQTIKTPTAVTLTASVTKTATCTTGATITAVGGGGTPAYQYELRAADGINVIKPFSTSAVFTNLTSATYTIFIRDANLCVATTAGVSVIVTAPPTLTATLDASSDLCYDTVNKVKFVVNVTGGAAPFSYSLDGQAGQTSNIFSDVVPGTHSILVTDSNNCTSTIANIEIAPELKAVTTATKALDCSASSAAIITGTMTGGKAPFTVTVLSGTGPGTIAYPTATTFTYTTAVASTYQFKILDANGCSTTTTATIDPITNPTATAVGTDPSCNNGTDGQITITGAGGSGGFTYSFNGGSFTAPDINPGLNAFVGAVNTKDYTYQVKDSKGCLSPVYTITLNNPTPVVAAASFVANTTCSTTTVITLSGSGGSGSYTYNFDGSATYSNAITKTFTNTTSAQTITYSVKDSKGCINNKTIDIPAYNPPTDITFSTPAAISCKVGFTTTSITLTSVAGIAPFTYTVISGPALVGTSSTGTFSGLTAGNYVFEVKDANGCTKQASKTIDAVPTIAVAGAKTDIKCFGTTDGTATFTVTGASSSGNYNYTLSPVSGTVTKTGNVVTVTGLPANTYTLTVTDITTGCISNTASVTIAAPSQITFTLGATKISCNNKISTISFLTLSGGTPGYTYAYVVGGAAAPAAGAYSTVTTVDTAVLTNTIDVYVKDINGCIEKKSIVIGSEAVPTIDPQTPPCYAGTPITVTITGTATGTQTYSKDGINFQASPTFTLSPGSYTLTIKDGFGCTAYIPYVIATQLTITATPVVDVTCTADTTINFAANGGTGAYTYAVSFNGGAYSPTTSPYVTAIAGTYTFRVTDSATPACQAVSTDIIVVTKATVLTLTTTKVDVKCKGDNTGSITVTATSGKAPFTYSKDGGTTYVVSNIFANLIAGTYNIMIKDALGCTSVSTPVTISEPLIALSATAAAPATTTCSTATTVTVTASNGTPGYTYSFNGGAFTTTNTYVVNDNGTSDQTVAYQVKDANGCLTVSQNIVVKKLNPPTGITFSGLTPITCNATTTNITLTTVNGVAPFTYIIVSGTTINTTGAATGIFTGLLPGDYVFEVTDVNGCSKQEAKKIAPVAPIVATATKLADVKCFGDATGSISYNVSGFTTYSYTLNGVATAVGQTATTFTLSGLAQGVYSVVFTDETTLCTATTSITITQPTAALTASLTGNVNANCKTPYAVVTITATGGTPNYKYAFVQNGVPPVASDYVISNIANLDPTVNTQWDVWVQDANGCTTAAPIDVTIVLDPKPTVTTSVVGQCTATGSTFQIVAVGAGGVAPYIYSINTGVSPSPADTFTVAPGTYTVTVTDANGCTGISTVTVNEVLTATAILTKELDCTASADGTIAVTVLGGKGPFSYQVKIGAGAYGALVPFAGTTFTYTATTADTYQFQITDSNVPACTKETNVITVKPIVYPLVTLVAETQKVKCNGDDTGIITVTIDATQGVGPFEYSINGGAYQSSNIFTGLTAGTYNITVRDSKGCINTVPASITITEPAKITFTKAVTPITCISTTGVSLGSITINSVTGGTPNYTYHVTGVNGYDVKFTNQTGAIAVFDVVDFGLYQIIITDANGCTAFENNIVIASPPDALDITVTAPPADCSALGSALIAVGTSPTSPTGVGPYHFAVYSPGLLYTSPTTLPWYNEDATGSKKTTIPNLLPGVTYTFIVHDNATGCYYFETAAIAIPTNSTITVAPLVANNITCKGAADGSVTFTMNQSYGVPTPVKYQIYNALSVTPVGAAVSATIPATGSLVVTKFGVLPFGNYFVLVTEAAGATHAGCSVASVNFNITESAVALTLTASVIKNENCNNLGIINALAKDGTAPYLYMVTTSATAPLATDPLWAATSTFNLAAGNYYVHAKDAYGCIQPSAMVPLVKDPTPLIDLTVTDNCVVEGTFELNVALTTAGIAPYTIVVNGSAAQNVAAFPFVVSGLNSGLQSVTVTDSNGCSVTQTLTIDKPLVATPAITALSTCLNNDGVITMSGTGGTGVYSYTISPVAGTITGNMISGLPAGTYTVTMTDTATPTNCSTTAIVTLSVPTPVTFTTATTPALCVGNANGSITVTLGPGINDNPAYTYEIIAPITRAAQSSNVFNGLLADTYTVRVNSGRGCFTDDSTVVVAPAVAIVATTTVTTKLTCDSGNNPQQAIVTVTGAGGTGTYEYSFDGINYSNKNTYETFSPETVTGYVRDANKCVASDSKTVNTLNPPTEMDIAGTPVYCAPIANTTSTVTITNIVNGVGPYTYQNITSGTSNATGSFPGLAPGDYTFQVTDDNGCTYQEIYKVNDVTPIVVLGAIDTNISCNGSNGNNGNGSAKYTVTGFSATGNYSIVVTSVPAALPYVQTATGDVISLTGLSAGTYTVTVTDVTTGCQNASSVTLVEPLAITFTATPSNVFCTQTVSQITVSGVTGGTGVYTYAAVKAGNPAPTVFDTNPVISVETNLTDLVWDVYVQDANGCVSVKVITTVIRDAAPTITVPAGKCFTGSPLTTDLSIVTTTYNGNKSYTINGFPIASAIATFNGAGTYKLGIKDDHGCEAFVDFIIEKQLLATATLTKDLYCAAPIDATIKVDIQDGVAPYSYQMYLGAATVGGLTPVVGTSFTATTLVAGTYHFVITDSNGASCSVTTNDVVVTTPATPTFTYSQINVSCTGGNNGSFTVIAAGGLVPYTYKITVGAANTTGDISGIYTGLAAGVYTVQVTDAKGCVSATQNITITEPIQLTATATPSINTTCSVETIITVVGQDGTPTGTGTGYYYSFDNGVTYDTSNTFTVNDNGAIQTIKYSVKDANGCTTAPQDIVVNPLNKPTDLAFALTVAPTCPAQTATVTLTATNGVGVLTYTILPSVPGTVTQTGNVFAGLTPGDYTFQVTDANGCSYQELHKVDAVVNIEVLGQLITDMTCNTGDDGAVTFDVSKFSGNYNYTITKDGAAFIAIVSNITLPSISVPGLGFGVYEITVHDNITLCDKTASVTVGQPSIVTISEVSNVNANCKSNALVQVLGAGGTPDYTYAYVISGAGLGSAIFSNSDSASLDPAISNTWDFYAKDAHGCISAPLLVTIAMDPLPAGFTATATYCPTVTGEYTITVTDGPTGMGPYTYSIGTGFQTSKVFIVNAPGIYNLIVKDKFGCEVTFPAAVTILKPIAIDAQITALPSCTINDGSITASATGGSGNYSYQIDGGLAVAGATATFPGLASGVHTILVTDTNTGCTDTVTLNLSAATIVTGFGLTMTPVTCKGGTDGTITATMATPAAGVNDNPVYMYSLNGGVPQSSNIFSGLPAGIGYSVTVVSGRGCPANATIDVTEPGIITVPAPTVVQFGCTAGKNGANFATITVAGVAGGSGTYTIYNFIKNGVSVQRGASTSYIESNFAGGTYVVTVSDDKGCSGSTIVPIVIDTFTPLDKINVVVNNFATCTNDEDITVTAVDAANNPILGITYVITETKTAVTQTNNTGIFTGLLIGNYRITATNGTTLCTIETVHYVNNPNTFELKLDSVVDAICFGDTNGSAQVTFIDTVINATDLDQAGIFDYIVKDAAGNTVVSLTRSTGVTVTIPSLKAGAYSIDATLVNTPFCTASTNFTISQPNAKLTIAETHTEITCIAGNNDGTISVTATGGWPADYEFELIATNPALNVNYSTVSDFLNLTAGTYTINVKDSKGCVDTINVQLSDPTPITFTAAASATPLSCFGDTTATITVSTPTGGSGSYLYTLITTFTDGSVTSNGPQLDNIFTNLGVGSYQVQVSDTWNCSTVSTTPIVISEPTKVVASLVKATGITCQTDATLTLSVVGGKAPYTYSTDPNFATSINMTGSSITFPVIVGNYNYYVKDANGCISFASNDIKIDNLEPLLPNLDVLNAMVSCKGSATGVIVANASGGLGNYVYTLLDGAGNAIPTAVQTTPGRFDNLLAGFYQVIVVSGDCSSTSQIVEIKEPATSLSYTPKVSNITCNGAKNGRIEIIASGGTGQIKYAISPRMDQFFDTGVFENLVPDVYQVVIQDANGCFEVYDFEIKEPLELLSDIVAGSINEEFCAGDKDGAFSIDIEGGTLPYSVSLDNRNGTYTTGSLTQTFFDFNGLAGGDHTVYIRDANGCTTTVTAPLKESVTMNPKAVVQYDCVNNAAANTVTITIDDSITDPSEVDYAIDGGTFQSSSIFTNVAPGFHTVIARNLNGCEQPTVNFEVIQVNPLTLVLNDGGLNEIVAVATGGGGNYTYTFNGENYGSTSSFIIYKSGDYTVTVTDANGCTATATRYFTYIDVCIPNNFTPNGDNINDTWAPGCTVNYKDLVFSIFDRYGRKIGTYRVGQEWEGKYNGEELPSGDYWYILKLNDKKDDREFVGHFTLYR
ncbi:T9SS type B sorting domain-containing protein [Flavobacterium sp. I-SCBP12n]|uniref:T9SS type B sorting domain-containing protein n=1 Tax=Flavobacterium pygoscelis TaxID=2893176 RepID=A0A9X1XNQ1_9FLAO|nr:T9SS type B sorting domain-containing protein [Flavobacterium pygoscelis]MCK8140462.1 T9SS type B sorting domain-containing protein [Flavobacterium pygoscelis]